VEKITFMLTRRQFLVASALLASPFNSLAFAQNSRVAGIISPYQWGTRPIPVSGEVIAELSIVDLAVQEVMRKHGIVGCSICVTRDSEVAYIQAYGYAELTDKPFLPTTTTRCGSVAQAVTALAALVLIDEGQLSLDTKILPLLKNIDLIPKPVGGATVDPRIANVTVRHLMDHTSGLTSEATYTAWRAERNVAQLHGLTETATANDVAADALGNFRLLTDPGTRYQYANANYVLLARVIEAACGMSFSQYLSQIVLTKFGATAEEIHISRNQIGPDSPERGSNEAAYYQTSQEKFVSFIPSEQGQGRVFGEAYRGFAPEASDGAGGIACSAVGLARILTNLNSAKPAISQKVLREIITPPSHYIKLPDFNPKTSSYYSKGFDVRQSDGKYWLAHGGMTLHCGGAIGHNAGYQFAVLSNWNSASAPYVDTILNKAVAEAIATARARGVIA
jgi:CubicO group peptidase (beta-lactamase class C family)